MKRCFTRATLPRRRPRRARRGRATPPRRRRSGRRFRRRASSAARSRRRARRRRSPRTRARRSRTRARRRRRPGGSGVEQPRRVERHEVGAELVDRAAPRVLGGREEHPARRAAGTRRAAPPATRRAGRTPARARARAAARRCPGRRRRRFGRLRPRRAISSAPFGLVTIDPVVAGGVDRLVRRPLDLDQRALDDLVAERLEPRDERPGLVARPRDDHLHRPPGPTSRPRLGARIATPPWGDTSPLPERYRGRTHASVPGLRRLS